MGEARQHSYRNRRRRRRQKRWHCELANWPDIAATDRPINESSLSLALHPSRVRPMRAWLAQPPAETNKVLRLSPSSYCVAILVSAIHATFKLAGQHHNRLGWRRRALIDECSIGWATSHSQRPTIERANLPAERLAYPRSHCQLLMNSLEQH